MTARMSLSVFEWLGYLKAVPDALLRRKGHRAAGPPAVLKPWGSYTVLEEGPRHKVKRLTVFAGRRLSLQQRSRRKEYWVVLEGVARVTCGDRVFDLQPNESTIIPKESAHRLENPGTAPLQVIEIQQGDYFGEDDIVRLDDDYGRTATRPLKASA